MKKCLPIIVAFVLLLCFSLPLSSKAAVADGTYSLDYQVNKPGSNSASMANDYFLKPAKLIVANGKLTMQITIKNSAWVTEFNPPGGATVISETPSADQRVVQFSVQNADVTTIAMKIDIDDIDYHHSYSVDFVFDGSALPEAKAPAAEQKPAEQKPAEQVTPVKQEQPAEQAKPAEQAQPAPSNQSPGSNTSDNKPAANDAGTTPSTQSSQQAPTTQQPTNSTTTQTLEQAETVQEESAIKTDVEATTETEAVENPETSDQLPLLYVVAFLLAVGVLVSTRKTKTN